MMQQVRYQIFVSSTYEDMREERQQATQAILESGHFPAGMELFPASDDTQWELIKRVIEESDYYIVILAGRYGSIGPSGISYTEMEYDYATKIGIPVLGFVRNEVGEVPVSKAEKTDAGRRLLDAFRAKVTSRTCRKYASPSDLGMAVMKSLLSETRIRPRTGWVRADQARSDEDLQRERQLGDDITKAKKAIAKLERKLRDRAVLSDELQPALLAQGDDKCPLVVTFTDPSKIQIREEVELSWDEIFKIVAPSIYGYSVRKRSGYGQNHTYPFQDNLEEHIRTKLIDRVQNRKIKIEPSQIDFCIIQFKELGLMMFEEHEKEDGETFRGITLTEEGERRISLLGTRTRASSVIGS